MRQLTRQLRLDRWLSSTLVIVACGCSQAANVTVPQESTGLHLPSGIAQIVRPTVAIQTLTPEQNDETVQIKGTVIKQAPLLAGALYQLQDDSGTVWVLSAESAPPESATISVVGTVQVEAIAVEGIDISDVYLREISRTSTTGDAPPENRDTPDPATDESAADTMAE